MHRLLKYIAFLVLFVVSFLVFLYWVFPYDNLKDRIISGVERQLGGKVEIDAGELEAYWFTGVEIEKLEFSVRDDEGRMMPALSLDRIRVRVALFSLLIGSPRVSYLVRKGKGEIEGGVHVYDEGIDIDADIDDFNVEAFKLLASKLGINLSGVLDGYVSFKVDKRRPARSSGKASLDLKNFKIGASQAKLGPMDMPLPAIALTKAKGSQIKLNVGRGTMQIEKLTLAGGDLGLDVSGKVFLSNNLTNSRFNIRGSFTASEVLDKALPFLFIVEKEKKPDGSYPLTITGRISAPTIKVGTFTLPL